MPLSQPFIVIILRNIPRPLWAIIVPKKPGVSNYILTLEVYHQYIIKPLKLWDLIMPNTPQQPSGYQGYKITIQESMDNLATRRSHPPRWRPLAQGLRACHRSPALCCRGHLKEYLVGGFNPSEKYESQLGSLFPIYGKHVPNHQPE